MDETARTVSEAYVKAAGEQRTYELWNETGLSVEQIRPIYDIAINSTWLA